MRKAKILGEGLIEDPERMGEIDPPVYGDQTAIPYTPSGTRKIPEAIYGDRYCLLEGRYQKTGGKVSEMMFDIMHTPRKSAAWKLTR